MIKNEYTAIACGNCGFPISQAALDYKKFLYFVIELSSFQLKGCKKFTPKIALITNIKQAHLDYHLDIEDYYKSKYMITKNQMKNDFLILNLDDENCMSLFKNSEATKLTYSLTNKNADCYISHNSFYFKKERICSVKLLKQKSNAMKYNSLGAICVVKLIGISNKNIKKTLKNFECIKYRLEEIYKDVFNDAKSTNIYSTISAINEFVGKDIILICGGYDRKEELNGLDNYLDNIKCVFAYGQTKEKILSYFKKKKIDCFIFETLKEATLNALNTRKNEIILYSPMFASYDQYLSYEDRGKEFSKLILSYYVKNKLNSK
jgi:UDP-N-acetylmuramoylalanine--D-glutamate ligase